MMRSTLCLLALVWSTLAGAGSFALIGDMPYSVPEIDTARAIIAEIGRDRSIAFIVHDGDIKSGGEPCTDALLTARRDDFNASRHPFVLVPGDNEWTDCHRRSNGGFDPEERLAKLRELFYAGEESLGQRRIPLTRQGAIQPDFAPYRENVRWEFESTLIVGMNLPGSNNNWKMPNDRGGDNREFEARLKANTAWLADAFKLAQEKNLKALMVIIQANPDFEGGEAEKAKSRPGYRDGYAEFRGQLAAGAKAFGKPVVIVHGDTHSLQINKPVKDETGALVPNITRLETYGSPFLGWVKVTVDPANPEIFKLDPRRFTGKFQE
jgi:hypothetical protein